MPRPSRRAEVRATAARIIREYGYDAATMDQIAGEAGLNAGTVYHYFDSKSALLFELLSDQVDATLEIIGRVPPSGTPAERMRALVTLLVEHVSTRHDELVVFVQEIGWIEKRLPADQVAGLRQRIERYERFTRQLLIDGVRSGEFREQDPSMIMYSIIGILGSVPIWFRGTDQKAQRTLVDELTEFIMTGILAQPARRGPPSSPGAAPADRAASGDRAASAAPSSSGERAAIEQLVHRYDHILDNGDWHRLDELFAPDGLLVIGSAAVTCLGPAEIGAYLRTTAPPLARYSTNAVIEVDGDRATARVKAWAPGADGGATFGTYSDELVRTAQGWRITRRDVQVAQRSASADNSARKRPRLARKLGRRRR